MSKEFLSSSMPKLILAVVLIVCVGAVMGLMGWALTREQTRVKAPEVKAPAETVEDEIIEDETVEDEIVEDETVDWQTYRNEEFGFEVKYPNIYKIGVSPQLNEYQKSQGMIYLVHLKHSDINASISVRFTNMNFNLQDIKQRFAPTGNESLPEQIKAGQNTFYFYGSGGGGVSYPDNYFYDLNGKILIIDFDGPYISDKTPSDEIKQLESQILSSFKFIEKEEKAFSCGTSTIRDIDGNFYNTVKIGEQCWMKENLKVIRNPQKGSLIRDCKSVCGDIDRGVYTTSFCHGVQYTSNCKQFFGNLYTWDTAMNGSTQEGVQGICPDGWHIPTDLEWHSLEKGLSDGSCLDSRIGEWDCNPAGAKLKQDGSSSFEGFLAGGSDRFGGGGEGKQGYFWSSTETENKNDAWYRIIGSDSSMIARNTYSKKAGYSVRCLKD